MPKNNLNLPSRQLLREKFDALLNSRALVLGLAVFILVLLTIAYMVVLNFPQIRVSGH